MKAVIKEFWHNIQRGNRKGAFLVASYRIAHKCTRNKISKAIGFPYLLFYHLIVRDILSFDIHENTSIGENFCVWHCLGIVINPNVVIGENCTMRHNITIGNKGNGTPKIGNNVEIGAGAILLGGDKNI